MDRRGTHRKELAELGRPGQWQLDNQGERRGGRMDLTGSGCGVYVQGQAAKLREQGSFCAGYSFVLLFLTSGLSLPIFVFIVVRYAQAPGFKDPFGVQGFAMALSRMRILIIKKKKKKK